LRDTSAAFDRYRFGTAEFTAPRVLCGELFHEPFVNAALRPLNQRLLAPSQRRNER
jgi:hypothetical protein